MSRSPSVGGVRSTKGYLQTKGIDICISFGHRHLYQRPIFFCYCGSFKTQNSSKIVDYIIIYWFICHVCSRHHRRQSSHHDTTILNSTSTKHQTFVIDSMELRSLLQRIKRELRGEEGRRCRCYERKGVKT